MKRNWFISVLIICLLLMNFITVDAVSNIYIDSNKAKEGIVRIYCSGINTKIKVMVEKGSTRYFYDLKKEEDFFPLQLGQGDYKVAVLENVTGTKYKVVAKKSFKAEITEENSVYLNSIQPILWDEDMEAIKLAHSITEDMKGNINVVQALYNYVINSISYDYKKADKLSLGYTPEIDTVLKDGKGICYDYSVLFAAILRSRGIPAKLVKGYRNGTKEYHAWNEVYLDGSWKIIDTTYSAWAIKAGTSYQVFQDESKYEKMKEY